MTDKYEEFKEWWSRKGFTTNPFIEFEEEQAEKDKKEEIIMEITKIKMNTGIVMPSGSVYSNITFNSAEKIYDKLKEKDLIK